MLVDTKPTWIDVEQNTEEWFKLRLGKLGGSSIGKVMANFGKPFGKPAHNVAHTLALESLTGERHDTGFSNSHMERGLIEEPIARALYVEETEQLVTNGGYYDIDDLIGFSPDGLIDDSGMCEIKSVIKNVHDKTIKRNGYDPKYKWQLIYNLKYSGLEWIDYIEYCGEYPVGEQLFVERLYAETLDEEFWMIDARIEEFRELLSDKMDEIIYYSTGE